MLKSEQTARAVAETSELRSKVQEYNQDFAKEVDDRAAITADMTRQYKNMENTLIAKTQEMEAEIQRLKDELGLARQALNETARENDAIISLKDAEIAEQKQRMEEMSIEFGDMLKDTLDRMGDRIEMTSSNWEGTSGTSDPASRSKLDQFSLGHVEI